MAPLRRAGGFWRLKADTYLGGGAYGDSYHVGSNEVGPDTSVEVAGRAFWARHTALPGTELDEVVVGRWLHLEQMGPGSYWLDVAGVTVNVQADRDGRPLAVTVEGPDVDGVRPGCRYALASWPEDTAPDGGGA